MILSESSHLIMRDIYDPPPARVTLQPAENPPLYWTGADLVPLVVLISACIAGAWWAWTIEPVLWPVVLVGGLFVSFETWFSAMTFLQRHPDARGGGHWRIFAAAISPWAVGLGLAAMVMISLFAITDWALF